MSLGAKVVPHFLLASLVCVFFVANSRRDEITYTPRSSQATPTVAATRNQVCGCVCVCVL